MTATVVARPAVSAWRGMLAMGERDLRVLRRGFADVLMRSLAQPILFVLVFTYVYPKLGGPVGPQVDGFSLATVTVPGVISFAAMFCGLFAIGLPMAVDLGLTREIDDRAMAPVPTWCIPVLRLLFGAAQSTATALLVLPLFALISLHSPDMAGRNVLAAAGAFLLTGLMTAALGLLVAGAVPASKLPIVMSVVQLPLLFLGTGYYPFGSLDAIPWLRVVVLLNPMTYVCEALRGALTPNVPHMSLWISMPVGFAFVAVMAWVGGRGVVRQVVRA